ncbi:hypothetical protein Desor_1537 [Desulfosporosinus orientis DSM 765]|uniref:Fibronectin type III domain-containing protein n=1 Tax=Desulfosporosinus orientis (strain ATCC 19365 / DSM 765 / NCIMB 8382 / VKM B-1628 / Singapore I) TaxID=768706 RepID=G7WCZ3_DESOD|nr:hypothetical protein [Desulfosporosinus orientis]AET67188.1 hypothetical protein Desor_1537 [Desulfosporosinus orientis DSM 765]
MTLSMIAHGTDGRDGLEAGIHLRWSFDPALGFPLAGFRLYRRASLSLNAAGAKMTFEQLGDLVKPPYSWKLAIGNNDCSVSLTSTQSTIPITGILVNNQRRSALAIDGKATITFSQEVRNIEIDAYFSDNWSAELTAKTCGTAVERLEAVDIVGQKTFTFSAQGINSIDMQGKHLQIYEIRFYSCEDLTATWEGPINEKGGFGLPVNISKDYILDLFKKNPGMVYPGHSLAQDLNAYGSDWLLAAARLPRKVWKWFRGKRFSELQEILKLIVENSNQMPMGWPVLNLDEKSTISSAEAQPAEFRIPALDLVLMATLKPYIARMLGLYWVDKDVVSGRSYDYKIVAGWPQGTFWTLDYLMDFEKYSVGESFYFVAAIDNLVFETSDRGTIVKRPLPQLQINQGLRYQPGSRELKIRFTRPVKEVQVFLTHEYKTLNIEAYQNNRIVDSLVFSKAEGLAALHSRENIDFITIKGISPLSRKSCIILYKLSTGETYIPEGEYHYILYNIRKESPKPVPPPEGLQVEGHIGMTMTQDNGQVADNRYTAALCWDLPTASADYNLVSSPVSYHVKRQTAGSPPELLTWGRPAVITEKAALESLPDSPPIYYTDTLPGKGHYQYSIAAVDIWGRIGSYSNWQELVLKSVLPPPPADIEAKYLEAGDNYLSAEEAKLVDLNESQPLLKVRWKWTDNLQRQAPDVVSFNVYFQLGWLNSVQGYLAESPAEKGNLLELMTSYLNPDIPADSFAGMELRLSQETYTIVSSKRAPDGKFILSIDKPIPKEDDFLSIDSETAAISEVYERGDYLQVRLAKPEPLGPIGSISAASDKVTINQISYSVVGNEFMSAEDNSFNLITVAKRYPQKGEYFSVVWQPTSPAYKDFSSPLSWQQKLLNEGVSNGEQYEVYIKNPPLSSSLEDKTVYAQIGISAINDDGEGPVSSPAAVMAVFRVKPPAQPIADAPGVYATSANFYGKSSYAVRWSKDSTLKYFVYRAVDENLFAVDAELRQQTTYEGMTESAANALINELKVLEGITDAQANENLRKEIWEKVINPRSIDYAQLYLTPHKNILFKVLANLPGNEKAFAKLYEKAIEANDLKYKNRRNYWEEETMAVDNNALLYVDDTLDGTADNCYFYRVRTVNEVGALGDFGPATYPVYMPAGSLQAVPQITRIEGGDRQITIEWSPCHVPNLAGYLVYRADSEALAKDIRRMIILKKDPGDAYSVTAGTNSLYIDLGIEGGKKYFYRVVALSTVEERGSTLVVRSAPSLPAAGQAYDRTSPLPPVISHLQWVKAGNDGIIYGLNDPLPTGVSAYSAVYLAWDASQPDLSCLVQFKAADSGQFKNASGWLAKGQNSFLHKNDGTYHDLEYRLKVVNKVGNMNIDFAPAALAALPSN